MYSRLSSDEAQRLEAVSRLSLECRRVVQIRPEPVSGVRLDYFAFDAAIELSISSTNGAPQLLLGAMSLKAPCDASLKALADERQAHRLAP